jgi:acetate kinase
VSAAILTLNAGSSSLKAALFDVATLERLATGHADRIGGGAMLTVRGAEGPIAERAGGIDDHAGALAAMLEVFAAAFPGRAVRAVGHRVVHGGPNLADPVVLDAALLAGLAGYVPFAPLHQPHNLAGIAAAQAAFPGALQVGCFDTAFHRQQPRVNDTFALPRAFYARGIRRYGFHGLSYAFVAGEIARVSPTLAEGRVVIAHLGNGASMCALMAGRSVASTMGFSALDGLPMGTRCGQLDPGVLLHLMREGMDAGALEDLLYRRSGLLGLSGISHDMRILEASGAPEAAEAIDYFVFRIRRELGGLAAALGGIDALVFTGGIGENSRLVRRRVCEGMGWIGIDLDNAANEAGALAISAPLSRTAVLVIPTNEELVIARATQAHLARAAA